MILTFPSTSLTKDVESNKDILLCSILSLKPVTKNTTNKKDNASVATSCSFSPISRYFW
jgi:hypothetical protein